MNTSTKTTLYLPEELHAAVKIEAAKQRISMTKLIIQAIERELEKPAGKQENSRRNYGQEGTTIVEAISADN